MLKNQLYTCLFDRKILLLCLLPIIPAVCAAQDSVYLAQQLVNGRVWSRQYGDVHGNEFFMTDALLPATVKTGGRTFSDRLCWYDEYNDQLVMMTEPGSFITANKEKIEEFTLHYPGQDYRFVNDKALGYVCVVYAGKHSLVIRYRKEIRKNAVENRYDAFEESKQMYIVSGDNAVRVGNRNDFLKSFGESEEAVKTFLKQKVIRVSLADPGTMVKALEYYETL